MHNQIQEQREGWHPSYVSTKISCNLASAPLPEHHEVDIRLLKHSLIMMYNVSNSCTVVVKLWPIVHQYRANLYQIISYIVHTKVVNTTCWYQAGLYIISMASTYIDHHFIHVANISFYTSSWKFTKSNFTTFSLNKFPYCSRRK